MMVLSMSLTSRILLVIAFSVRLFSQETIAIPPGSRLFIAKMEGGLDGFIPPEIHKQKVPFSVVLDDKDADFVLTGVSQKGWVSLVRCAGGRSDRGQGQIRSQRPTG